MPATTKGSVLGRLRRIELRLPLSIAAVLLLAVGAFSIMAYREVRDSALVAAGDRLTDIARRINDLMARSVDERYAEIARVAGRVALGAALSDARVARGTEVETALRELLESSPQVDRVTLWSAAGERVAEATRAGESPPDSAGFPAWAPRDRPAVGEFRAAGDVAWYDITAPVTGSDGTSGVLVQRRLLGSNPAGARLISDLTGLNARVFLGRPGGIWTDLVGVVEGPPVSSIASGVVSEYDQDGERRLGAGLPITRTSWFTWVDAPRGLVMARPSAFVERMLPLGFAVVLGGALLGWLLSRSMTRRLSLVSATATAVAAGDYGRRVPAGPPDELGELADAFNVMAGRVAESHGHLERLVAERTVELERYAIHLEAANRELEAFSYSVSHDLRSPLRALHGFSEALLEDYEGMLDDDGRHYLERVCAAADRMGTLIDDLLQLSRISRAELSLREIDLSGLARELVRELEEEGEEGRSLEVSIQPELRTTGDPQLIRIALRNLLENAWKFTSLREDGGRVHVGASANGGGSVFFVRDNGAGFDMEHADKLFTPFQRLHRVDEFPGTGIGLATVQRVIRRHGGRIWAESAVGEGATFFFTLFESAATGPEEAAAADGDAARTYLANAGADHERRSAHG